MPGMPPPTAFSHIDTPTLPNLTNTSSALLHSNYTLHKDPYLGPVFLYKVDFSNAYIRVWIRSTDIPHITLVVTLHPSDTQTLIGLHVSLPMGYVDISIYFCCTGETISDLAHYSWGSCTF